MGSDFAPFTGPRLRALQMIAFQQDIEARREQRDRQRQAFLMDIEDRKRRQAVEDFQTGMALHSSGLAPVAPGVAGQFQAGMSNQPTITAPGGGQYAFPSPEQSQARAYSAAESKGVASGITKRTEKNIADPWVDVESPEAHPMGGRGTFRVRESERAKTIQDAYERTHPKLQFHWEDDGQGNTTMIGVDPQGEVKIQKPFKGISKPSPGEKPDYEAEVLAGKDRSTERARRVDEMMPWAFNKLGIAGDMQNGTFMSRDKNGQPITVEPEESERARKLAEATVDRAMKDELEQEVARRKVGARGATSKTKPDPFARKSSLKIGDKRTVRGKLMTITKVYPDGTFDAQ